jgi:D-alanine-D-alanine ligase
MRIGLTYDLRSEYLAQGYSEDETAEFDKEETIDAIEAALQGNGHRTERIGNVRRLVGMLAEGRRWDLVFNIAEGLQGVGREAQVPAVLEAFDIPYTFSDPLVMSLTLHKAITKRVLRDAGVPTSDFAEVAVPDDARAVLFAPPYFVKPVAEGTGKGVTPRSIVSTREALPEICAEMIAAYRQPALVEPFLSGREFTVGIVGTGCRAQVLGTVEIHLLSGADENIYSYLNKAYYEQRVTYHLMPAHGDPLIRKTEEVALAAWRVLGCRDAGRVDLRCDASGNPLFMEVNPLAGLHPVHSDLPIICQRLAVPYTFLIEKIVASARERTRPAADRPLQANRCA